MRKNVIALLNAINAKKAEVQAFVDADKIEEAKVAKDELQKLQNKFDLIKDIEDPEPVDTAVPTDAVPVEPKDAIAEFADAARHLFRNASNNEGTGADGGYTVPQDIQTRINKYKEAKFSLADLVTVETVSAPTGRRTFQSKAQHTGFTAVAEQGVIGQTARPQFEVLNYAVQKYAGYLPVTNELLEDSDANIANTLIQWLGEEDIATRNAQIIAKLKTKTATVMAGLDDIKKAINVTLGAAYAGSVVIVTNDDGLQYLDTLKDQNKQYLLKPSLNPDAPMSMYLAVGARRIPVKVVPNAILATVSDAIPFFVGDLKEAIVIFDRKKLTIMNSNVASVTGFNAFEQDMTLFRGIERLDCKVRDAGAWVYGTIAGE